MPQGEMYRGDKIGNYEVLTQLSVGGMAELFLCFTQGAGAFRKFVVVKRILPDVKHNESYIKMFYDEARITSVLHHPNIAQVLDLGGEGEQAYIAMEFIAGQNLNQISAACLKRKKLIPLGLSVSVCRDVCHALHYAHTIKDAQGRESPIIHRDVAQKNVMVTYEGAVKLLDFGIAKARGSLGRTTAGMVKGTTGYMSPEQVRGEALDGRSDVFCLGVVLFELLTGKRLFAAETETEEMERILAAPIPRPDSLQRKIPSGLVEVVLKALARDRSHRFSTARAMAKALDEVASRWMFDNDKRASFMRALFSERIDATRRLLESAGRPDASDEYRRAAHTLTEDAGAVFPELYETTNTDPEYLSDGSESTVVEVMMQETPPPPVPGSSGPSIEQLASGPAVAPAPPPVPVPSTLEPAPLAPPVPEAPPAPPHLPPLAEVRPPEPWGGLSPLAAAEAFEAFDDDEATLGQEPLSQPSKPSKWPLRIVALAALGAGVGAAAWLRGPRPESEVPLPEASLPVVLPVAPAALPEQEVLAPASAQPVVEEGLLTLITTPRATVMRGTEKLGQTPLKNVRLPAGKHRLTLLEGNGRARQLDVKIQRGQTTRETRALATLPLVQRP